MNCHRQADGYRLNEDATQDIKRIQAIWLDLRTRFGSDGDFLCGQFGIVDAMFAPVCIRFESYGVALDENARNYVKAIYQLPAMQCWLSEAKLEPPKSTSGVT